MIETVNIFRVAALCAWTVPFVALMAPVGRTLRKAPKKLDPIFSLFWFVAMLNIAFISRWFLAPNEQMVWCLLYSVSVVCALGVFGVWRSYDQP